MHHRLLHTRCYSCIQFLNEKEACFFSILNLGETGEKKPGWVNSVNETNKTKILTWGQEQ